MISIIIWSLLIGIVIISILALCLVAAKVFTRMHHLIVFLAFAAAMILYAGTKHGTVSFPTVGNDARYIFDRGSYVTNDYVHIDFWTVAVPASANLFIHRRPLDETNDFAWVEHLSTTIGQFNPPQDIFYPDATNYDWIVYSDWTPGPAVQTNGVWHTYWGVDRQMKVHIIPLRTAIRVGDTVIATPKSKADSERNEQ